MYDWQEAAKNPTWMANKPGEIIYTSVNKLTDATAAPLSAMNELRKAPPPPPCLIYTVACAPDDEGPILFCKLDIKDGFGRMCVPAKDEVQFCYVLPLENPKDEPMIVIWCTTL